MRLRFCAIIMTHSISPLVSRGETLQAAHRPEIQNGYRPHGTKLPSHQAPAHAHSGSLAWRDPSNCFNGSISADSRAHTGDKPEIIEEYGSSDRLTYRICISCHSPKVPGSGKTLSFTRMRAPFFSAGIRFRRIRTQYRSDQLWKIQRNE